MLKISIFELFVALIPETFIFIFGAYVLSNTRFDYKKIIITGLIAGFATYLIRLLPIFPGVNMIFVILVIPLLLVVINHIEIMKAIPSVLLLLITRLGTETLNIILLDSVLQMKMEELTNDPIKKTLFGMPSLLLFALVIFIFYRIKYVRNKVA